MMPYDKNRDIAQRVGGADSTAGLAGFPSYKKITAIGQSYRALYERNTAKKGSVCTAEAFEKDQNELYQPH